MINEDMIDNFADEVEHVIDKFTFFGIVFQVETDIKAQEKLLGAYGGKLSVKQRETISYRDLYRQLDHSIMSSILFHLKPEHLNQKEKSFLLGLLALVHSNIKLSVLIRLGLYNWSATL